MNSKHITPNLAGLLINAVDHDAHKGFKLTATVEVKIEKGNIIAVSTVDYNGNILVGDRVLPVSTDPAAMQSNLQLSERVVRAAMDSTQGLKQDSRLKTCIDCVNVQSNTLGGVTVYSCMHNDKIVPQYSELGNPVVFHRVPKWCPRPDTEVLKSPKGTEFNEEQIVPKDSLF